MGQRYFTEIKTSGRHFPIPTPQRFLLNQCWLWFHTSQAAQPLLMLLQSLLRQWLCHLSSLISGNKTVRTLVHASSLNSIQANCLSRICVLGKKKRNWLVHLNQNITYNLNRPQNYTSKCKLFLTLSYLFFYNFISLFLAVLALCGWVGFSLVAMSRGHSPAVVHGFLITAASLVEQRL